MSKTKTEEAAAPAAAPAVAAAPVPWKVKITEMGTRACGAIFAKGAVVSLPQSVAQTLEKQGKAVILGV